MARPVSPLATTRPQPSALLSRSVIADRYFNPAGQLSPLKNGTSGHRGLVGAGFADLHVAAMTQACVNLRASAGRFGPMLSPEYEASIAGRPLGSIFLGKDVRHVSDFAQNTVCEVLAGNGQRVIINSQGRPTPTPVISFMILSQNLRNMLGDNSLAEGMIDTASHNAPSNGGIKTNGFNGGPNVNTAPIDELGNALMASPELINRMPYAEALERGLIVEMDMMSPYVEALSRVVRMDLLKGMRFGATPLGGSGIGYFEAINQRYGTNISVLLGEADPEGAQKVYDWDGELRGDPSSWHVMQVIKGQREMLGVPFLGALDNDSDRFGGEDATGLLTPNQILCVLADYLSSVRGWPTSMRIGRTIGTTHMLDAIAGSYGRTVHETNVGFKYFVDGLFNRGYVIAGEESSGCQTPAIDGSVWVTEKDGIAAVLLMMEAIAHTGKDLGTLYADIVGRFGPHPYTREDTAPSEEVVGLIRQLSKDTSRVSAMLPQNIAGSSISQLLVGDGIKIVLANGAWILIRPSGTEPVVKNYMEAPRFDNLDPARRLMVEAYHHLGLGEF